MSIMHVDMNSYFATVEQQSNPTLRGKPICVAGKGTGSGLERTVCCAASVEAKKFGLKSGFPVWEAKKLCPALIIVPADYAKYEFVSRQVFRILENYSPIMEIFSIDEAFLDLNHIKSNVKILNIAQAIKERIKTEIGDYLKCSIGISHNKLLAKLASEMKKPDGLTVIDKTNLAETLAKTPIEDLCGVGRRLQFRLNNLGIKTVKELGDYPLERLIGLFGPHQGKLLHLMGLGKDFSRVTPRLEIGPEKSFGHSYTLPRNMSKVSEAEAVLLKLCQKVGRRMRKAGFLGRTLHIYVRFLNLSGFGKRLTLKRYLNDGLEIYELTKNLLGKNLPPIRAIGVSVSNLKHKSQVSQSILVEDKNKENMASALDKINDRYGEFTVYPAALVQVKNRVQQIPDGRNKRFTL